MKKERGILKNVFNFLGKRATPLSEESSQLKKEILTNSLNLGGNTPYSNKAINSKQSLRNNSITDFITLDQSTLTYMFLNDPVAHTVVTKPVQDALRGGILLDCEALAEETKDVLDVMETTGAIDALRNTFFWSRLYGGGAILINQENADPTQPFSIASIKRGENIEFYALDRWQIQTNSSTSTYMGEVTDSDIWVVNGIRIHSSRFIVIKNREIPSDLRATFKGWGYSELEKMVRALNSFSKSEDVFFELADEAKIDIMKIGGLNTATASDPNMRKAIEHNIQNIAYTKNFQSIIVMDKEDDYESKQINLSGVVQMNQEARLYLSIASGLPQDILIGNGASGFSSGEDVIERYNAMVESEIRTQMIYPLNFMKQIIMRSMYGVVYKSSISFKSLRVLSAEQEEAIKTSKLNRLLSLYEKSLVTQEQVEEYMQKHDLLGV